MGTQKGFLIFEIVLLQNKLVLALEELELGRNMPSSYKGSCKYGKNPTSKNEVQKKNA